MLLLYPYIPGRYGVGSFFVDFTFCTLKRDERSVGNILNRAIGDVLCKSGYTHWYWGFALPYMREYDVYGGAETLREHFYDLFEQHQTPPETTPADVIASGLAIIKPRTRH